MQGVVAVRFLQAAQGFPGLSRLQVQAAQAFERVGDQQGIARRPGIAEGFLVGGEGQLVVFLLQPGLADVVIEDGIALVPAVFVENVGMSPITLYRLPMAPYRADRLSSTVFSAYASEDSGETAPAAIFSTQSRDSRK